MKAYVIGIEEIPESLEYAHRCINSFKNFQVNLFPAITPKNTNLEDEARKRKLNLQGFTDRWSRKENAIACFLSHHSLWMKSYEEKEELLILEHDAVCVSDFPTSLEYDKILSLGKPSFGKFNIPRSHGVNPLTSKLHFPGAHAYLVKAEGAKILLQQAKSFSEPTDVFLHLRRFPWLQEYYPWCVEVQDTFSTVQKEEGCVAKHSYSGSYKLI